MIQSTVIIQFDKVYYYDPFVVCTMIKEQFIFNNTLNAESIASINLLHCNIESCSLFYIEQEFSFEHPSETVLITSIVVRRF